jgi:thiamine-phosphate pyrophosphorylase
VKTSFFRNNSIYLITDRIIAGMSHAEIARRAVSAGIKVIQFREKNMSKKDIFREAISVRDITRSGKVKLIINDDIDIAMAVNADGVHLGQKDIPVDAARRILGKGRIIGISTHNMRQALKAQEGGADYIGFGPVFQTGTKDAGRPRGLKALKNVRERISIPVVAIGGIKRDNISSVINAGADACAIISGILAGDMKLNIAKYRASIKQG